MKFTSGLAIAAAFAASASAAEVTRLQMVNRLTQVKPNRTLDDILFGWYFENVTLAAVRAPPVNWPLPILNKNWIGVKFDINGTVDLGVECVKKAASNGVP